MDNNIEASSRRATPREDRPTTPDALERFYAGPKEEA